MKKLMAITTALLSILVLIPYASASAYVEPYAWAYGTMELSPPLPNINSSNQTPGYDYLGGPTGSVLNPITKNEIPNVPLDNNLFTCPKTTVNGIYNHTACVYHNSLHIYRCHNTFAQIQEFSQKGYPPSQACAYDYGISI